MNGLINYVDILLYAVSIGVFLKSSKKFYSGYFLLTVYIKLHFRVFSQNNAPLL